MRKGLANRFSNWIKAAQHRGVRLPVAAHIPDDTRGRPPVSLKPSHCSDVEPQAPFYLVSGS